ncbi:MAG TPA: hypothetical protein VFD70_25280 [Anaerolineae bacterium]|nr:hypothetical protein [Anaerolineae bacterium]
MKKASLTPRRCKVWRSRRLNSSSKTHGKRSIAFGRDESNNQFTINKHAAPQFVARSGALPTL